MTIALYMDEHVHRAITSELRRRDVDVLTVQEDGRAGTADTISDRNAEIAPTPHTPHPRPYISKLLAFPTPQSPHQLDFIEAIGLAEMVANGSQRRIANHL